jgi:hypothetical protein
MQAEPVGTAIPVQNYSPTTLVASLSLPWPGRQIKDPAAAREFEASHVTRHVPQGISVSDHPFDWFARGRDIVEILR